MRLLLLFFSLAWCQEGGSLTGITSQHNYYRCLHGSPFLIWSNTLQNSAMQWAVIRQTDSCIDLPSGFAGVGENMLWSHAVSRAGPKTVDAWYNNNPGFFSNPTISDIYGEFNQVIWKASLNLGCAVVTCPTLQVELVVCHYTAQGNVFSDTDAQANVGPLTRLVPECQSIATAHTAGMFVSPQTDQTNPAALAIGAGIGALTVLILLLVLWRKREAWKTWTSARLANQQILVLGAVEIALQITVFALMVRSIGGTTPWTYLPDGSWLNPTNLCIQRTANAVPGAPCVVFSIAALCSHEFTCNAMGAPGTANVFIILACVLSWFNLAVQVTLVFPKIPLDSRIASNIAAVSVLVQLIFVWLVLWFFGGYILSYLGGNGFPMAGEGSIEVIVCFLILIPMFVIATAEMTLGTK